MCERHLRTRDILLVQTLSSRLQGLNVEIHTNHRQRVSIQNSAAHRVGLDVLV